MTLCIKMIDASGYAKKQKKSSGHMRGGWDSKVGLFDQAKGHRITRVATYNT